eukprot:TRINITY_DN34572_c0_g1_i1.p1 TRINITY_DN34572_c0_g1~~TRINITY_DN34572_c0_g1_i1.p1  ORF type:complete len:133 (-),score=23.43 TRINITY_DN34572_c0_g1_i1:45-443(-)
MCIRDRFGCQGLGFRCQSAVNLTSQTYPCGVGFACRDDGIPWTSNASCPDSQICDFDCPPSMECEEDWQNGNTDLGCPAGWICKVPFDPIPGGGGCPAGHVLSLIHISEPTRLLSISYAVFCLKKKKNKPKN